MISIFDWFKKRAEPTREEQFIKEMLRNHREAISLTERQLAEQARVQAEEAEWARHYRGCCPHINEPPTPWGL